MSAEGFLTRGLRSLKRRKEEVEWCRAEVRKTWSLRRKETRLSGEPAVGG